nr:hypothetical protein [Apis mellifera nudivirus]
MELGSLINKLNESQNGIKSNYNIILIPGSSGCDFRHFTYHSGGGSKKSRFPLLIEPVVATADDYVYAATTRLPSLPSLSEAKNPILAPTTTLLSNINNEENNGNDQSIFLHDEFNSLNGSPHVRQKLANHTFEYAPRPQSEEERQPNPPSDSSLRQPDEPQPSIVEKPQQPEIINLTPASSQPILTSPYSPPSPQLEEIPLNEAAAAAAEEATEGGEKNEKEKEEEALLDLPLPQMFRSEPLNKKSQKFTAFLENSRSIVSDLFRGFTENYDIDGQVMDTEGQDK